MSGEETIVVPLSPDLAEALAAWIAMQPDPKPALPDAVSYALRDWLTVLGLLPFHDSPETAN